MMRICSSRTDKANRWDIFTPDRPRAGLLDHQRLGNQPDLILVVVVADDQLPHAKFRFNGIFRIEDLFAARDRLQIRIFLFQILKQSVGC